MRDRNLLVCIFPGFHGWAGSVRRRRIRGSVRYAASVRLAGPAALCIRVAAARRRARGGLVLWHPDVPSAPLVRALSGVRS